MTIVQSLEEEQTVACTLNLHIPKKPKLTFPKRKHSVMWGWRTLGKKICKTYYISLQMAKTDERLENNFFKLHHANILG